MGNLCSGATRGIVEGAGRFHVIDDKEYVSGVCFSPDNSILCTIGENVTFWKITSKRVEKWKVFPTNKVILRSCDYSPCGNLVATGSSDGTILLWNPKFSESENPVSTIKGHDDSINCVRFFQGKSDHLTLASTGEDESIRIWRILDQKGRKYKEICRMYLEKSSSGTGLDFFEEFEVVSGNDDGKIQVWDIRKGKSVASTLLSASIQTVRTHKVKKILAVGTDNKEIQLFKYDTDEEEEGEEKSSLTTTTNLLTSTHAFSLGENLTAQEIDFHFSGDYLVSGGIRQLSVFDVVNKTRFFDCDLEEHSRGGEPFSSGTGGEVVAVRISPSGEFIAASCDDKKIHIWKIDQT